MDGAQILGLASVASAIVLAWAGFFHSRRVAVKTAQTNIITETRADVALRFESFNTFIDQMQEDNKEFRVAAKESQMETREFKEALRLCGERVTAVMAERDLARAETLEARAERDECKRLFDAFRERYEQE